MAKDINEVQIDYTRNRVFTKIDYKKFFNTVMGIKYPWSFSKFKRVKSDNDLQTKKELFLTGTNELIKTKQMCRGMEKGEICVCCGVRIRKYPWEYRKYSELCDKCTNSMNSEYGDFKEKILNVNIKNRRNNNYPWWLFVED